MGTPKDQQILTLHRAIALVEDFVCAVDGGAADGEWTKVMALQFSQVYAFEPHPKAFELLHRKMGDAHNVSLFQKALWSETADVHLCHVVEGSPKWRGTYVKPGGDVPAVTIDSFQLPHCGLIKLDVEGAELHALTGAVQTLIRHKPVVIVECKPGYPELFGNDAEAPGNFLMNIGAREAFRFGPDRVYQWAR